MGEGRRSGGVGVGLFASFTANYVPRAHLVHNRISELIVPLCLALRFYLCLLLLVLLLELLFSALVVVAKDLRTQLGTTTRSAQFG